VIENRNPDKKQLQQKNARKAIQKLDLPSIGDRALEGFSVRNEVLEKECADGHDAAERMQTPQPKRNALASAQRGNPRLYL
jgi:hypothetical protein